MKLNIKLIYFKTIYIFIIFLSLILSFFSTTKAKSKPFEIENIEISKPFQLNFNKNDVIDEGFVKAFNKLVALVVTSDDKNKIKTTRLNEIKTMINSFSIKEEKFIDEIYYVNLGVSFSKKKIFNFLEKNNIFPTIPKRKKFLFIPIIIDEKKRDLLIFSNNKIFDEWNNQKDSLHLIEYILPTEDLEDLTLIKKQFNLIEQYDFKKITDKYSLNESIIALIFKNQRNIRILSKITINGNVKLKNQSFSGINLQDRNQLIDMISKLKTIYEDYWKNINKINTSIKFPLTIKADNSDPNKIDKLEKILSKTDRIYDFYISQFNKDFIYYQVVFNGTPNAFLKSMNENNFSFDTQNNIWILE